jgi:hypothetical protein
MRQQITVSLDTAAGSGGNVRLLVGGTGLGTGTTRAFGANTITFGNPSAYAPEIDKITVAPAVPP